jgi:1-phosphatidylinositol-4-phosphate 5-kinase
MLTSSSNSPYQHKSIRNAIRDDEHHIVRVEEEGTGETYDLNLSHATPYASPVVISKSNTNPPGKVGDVVNSKIVEAIKRPNGHSINDNEDRSPNASTIGSHRRILQLPQIVSRRHGGPTSKDSPSEMEELATGQVTMSAPRIVGELPPSPPLEPEYRNGLSNGNVFDSKQTKDEERGRIDPRRPLRSNSLTAANATRNDDRRGSNKMRDASDASAASTIFMSASSHDGSEDDDGSSIGRSSSKFGAAPIVSEPTSFLHPSSAHNHEAGPSSSIRRPSPVSSLSSTNTQTGALRQPRPTRRNTTGSGNSPGQKPRAGSVGSSGRGSLRGSKERDALPAAGKNDEEQINSPSPVEPPLRTGDAGLDEAIAKQYDVMRRQRETKKMQQHTVEPEQTDTTSRGGAGTLKRVRSGREEPRALIGNVIGEEHDNFVLMYNMLTGIRIGVSRCQAKLKRPLTDADYSAKHKFTFDIIGNELTPSAKYDFKFKDYAPWVFRELREHFYLDPADYLLSLTAKYILSELGSPGKSGSFFYFSRDYRFIIKTIRHNEHKFLLRILKEYHMHIKLNPHTLLSRFYGLHRVKLPGGKKIHFVIMNNLFPPHRDIHETYDLKGSAIGREYPEAKAAQKKGAVLKDLNWVNRKRELQLGPEKKALFEAQVRSDVDLLQRLGIMDYSLLIGLHDMNRGNSEGLREDALQVIQPDSHKSAANAASTAAMGLKRAPTTQKEKDAFALRAAVQRSDAKALGSTSTAKLPERETSDRHHFIFYQDEGGFRSTDEENRPTDWVYYFGIIDTLTLYNSVKRGEHYWKSLTNNHNMISSVHPVKYGKRFCNFLFSIIKGADQSQRPRMS